MLKFIGYAGTVGLTFLGLVFILSIIFCIPVYFLWNWVMPIIFGLTKITFWQAWGLTLLSGFLIKSNNSK